MSLSSFSDENNKAIVNKETYDNIYLKNYDDEMTEAFGIDKITTNAEFTAKDGTSRSSSRPARVS